MLVALLMGAGCSSEKTPAPPPLVRGRVIEPLGNNQVTIHEEKGLYTLRENRWSLYAWLDAARRSGTIRPRTLVHFGARSIFGPTSESLPSMETAPLDTVFASAIERLEDDAFLLAAWAAGWIDTVYWVQPEISCYAGASTSVRFDLEERGGRITPVRADSSAFDPLDVHRSAFEGEAVSRLFPIETAHGLAQSDWAPGPLQLHCLTRAELRRRLEQGGVAGPVWVDIDLDYFGCALPLEKAGYLALSDESDLGVGMLGPAGPVFRSPPDSVRARAAAVADLMGMLAPEAITVVESPARSHAETLPEVESILRTAWIGPASAWTQAWTPQVSIQTASGRVQLDADCPIRVDVAKQDSLRLSVRWSATPPERMEISLLYGRRREPDRLIARWRTLADRPAVQVAVRLASSDAILESGWRVEVRRLRDGALASCHSFALDRGGARLDRVVSEQQALDPEFPGVETLRAQSAPELIVWGMRSQVPVTLLHEILIAHPTALRNQCDDLRSHWIARASVAGS